MSEVSRDSRSRLIQAVVHLVNKNFDKLSQDFAARFLSEEVNLEPIVPAFQDVFINAVEQGVSKWTLKVSQMTCLELCINFLLNYPHIMRL